MYVHTILLAGAGDECFKRRNINITHCPVSCDTSLAATDSNMLAVPFRQAVVCVWACLLNRESFTTVSTCSTSPSSKVFLLCYLFTFAKAEEGLSKKTKSPAEGFLLQTILLQCPKFAIIFGRFFFQKSRGLSKNSGVSPSFWQPGTVARWQPEFLVAGDFIGRQPEFLIAGLRKTAIIS